MKQIKFVDYMEPDKKEIHGGILLDNGDCICGCCGGIFEADERGETWDIVEVYDAWMNLDEEILGDNDDRNGIADESVSIDLGTKDRSVSVDLGTKDGVSIDLGPNAFTKIYKAMKSRYDVDITSPL